MSGIGKKSQSLGHCPIRSTDLRRSPGVCSASASVCPSPCASLSLSLSLCTLPYHCGLGLDHDLDLGHDLGRSCQASSVKRQASSVEHPRSARSGRGITRTVPSQQRGGPSIQWCVWMCAGRESEAIRNPWLPGSQVGPWSPQHVDCRQVGDDQDGEADPLDAKLSILDTERERDHADPDGANGSIWPRRAYAAGRRAVDLLEHAWPGLSVCPSRAAGENVSVATRRGAVVVCWPLGLNEMRPLHQERRSPV